jgi:glycosyltransferase involved in cell wall biosynthesis
VLIEAQIAGTPVVAPAYGGSHDAYVHGITGDAPLDETAGSLAHVISSLLDDPRRLASMASRAAIWARESFDPDRYSTLAVQQLLRGR